MAEFKRLEEAIADFISVSRKKRAKTSGDGYAYTLDAFRNHVGNIQVRYLTETHLEDFFYGPRGLMAVHHTGTKQAKEAVAATTHNNYRQRLATFFAYCTRKGWIKKELMTEVEVMEYDKFVPRLRLRGHQLIEMLDHCDNARDRAYIAFAQNTLKRASEIIPLTVSHVDLDTGWMKIYNRKTKKWDRYPITDDLDHELRRWLVTYAKEIGRPLKGTDLLFPSRGGMLISHFEGGKPVRKEPVLRPDRQMDRAEDIIKRVLAKMGLLEKGTGTHTIRRSVARAQFDRLNAEKGYGSALSVISAMLDHKSRATTEIYLGLDEDRDRRDQLMHGQPFISALVNDENVVPIRSAR